MTILNILAASILTIDESGAETRQPIAPWAKRRSSPQRRIAERSKPPALAVKLAAHYHREFDRRGPVMDEIKCC